MYYNNSRNSQIDTNSVVFYLIATNVLLFLVSTFLPGLFPENDAISFLGMHYPSSPLFHPFQILTHMFMHGGFMHILFNMYGLYLFGTILERVWGSKRFLEFYFLTGLGAMLLHMGVQALQVYNITGSLAPNNFLIALGSDVSLIINTPVVGASGAIFGILTAFAMLFPNTELFLMFIPIPIKAKYAVGGYFAYELFSGLRNNPTDNIAHFAHVGGALIGFIIVKIWNRNRNSLY